MKARMIDEAQFVATAGKGGDGAISFRREKYIRKGGPDGGDGGRGGSIRIIADAQLNTLKSFAGRDRFASDPGRPGLGAKRIGWDAEDKVLKVPIGTVVLIKYPGRLLTGRPFYGEMAAEAQRHGLSPDPAPYRSFEDRWPNGRGVPPWRDAPTKPGDWVQVKDMQDNGEEIVLARGGRGGLGNARFAHSRLTTPKLAQQGELGERFEVRLELKLLADVGLIGLPNVGKSTLLSLITAARPEIADYQFTTLSPNLGVMLTASSLLFDSAVGAPPGRDPNQGGMTPPLQKTRLVIADIPGLIEDASKGKGLGIAFLKHIERCTLLVHIIAPTISSKYQDTRSKQNPKSKDQNSNLMAKALWRDYETVRKEVGVFNEKMLEKPELVVVNKVDLVDSDQRTVISEYFKRKRKKILLVSAVTGEGLEELRQEIESLASEN